jgi:hypothetical protein
MRPASREASGTGDRFCCKVIVRGGLADGWKVAVRALSVGRGEDRFTLVEMRERKGVRQLVACTELRCEPARLRGAWGEGCEGRSPC